MSDATIQIHGERARTALNVLAHLWNTLMLKQSLSAIVNSHENLRTGKQRYETGRSWPTHRLRVSHAP